MENKRENFNEEVSLEENSAKANNAEISKFVRYEKGEGIEKKEENFAEEVMKQLQ